MIYKHYSGQSLLEAIVTVGIVLLLVTGLVVATISMLRLGQMSKVRTQALSYAKEGMEIVRMIRDTDWKDIPQNTTTVCLAKGAQTLGACPVLIDNTYNRTVAFSDEGTSCQQANDCRKVTVTVSWLENGVTRSVSLSSFLTNWRAKP